METADQQQNTLSRRQGGTGNHAARIDASGAEQGAVHAKHVTLSAPRARIIRLKEFKHAQYISKLPLSQVKQCSLQQQRLFAQAAVAPKLDWDSLEGQIASDEGKRDLASLRSTWIDVQQKFDSMAQVGLLSVSDQSAFSGETNYTKRLHRSAVLW